MHRPAGALWRRNEAVSSNAQTSGLDDHAFLQNLRDCRFGAGEFRHRDHVRLAWILLRRLPLAEVLTRVGTDLERFAAHHGASEIYNETLTWVYVMVINQRLNGGQTASQLPPVPLDVGFDEFCDRNPDLFQPVDQFMANFYPSGDWRSTMAKAMFILPSAGTRRSG